MRPRSHPRRGTIGKEERHYALDCACGALAIRHKAGYRMRRMAVQKRFRAIRLGSVHMWELNRYEGRSRRSTGHHRIATGSLHFTLHALAPVKSAETKKETKKMIARDVADLLHAVRIGKTKWIANCPAHDDQEFQLEITQIASCGTRVQCRHCSIDEIARAVGISRAELESHPVPEPDMDDLDDRAARRFLAAKLKRQEQHEISCGQIQMQLREVNLLRRRSETARRTGRRFDESSLTEALEELERLHEIEKKLRAPCKC